MWLICGLGNPGKKYFLTRHNVGFDVVDSLIDKNNWELYKGTIDNNECLFCKPLTYMNISGQPIREIVNFFKIPKSKIIVIHDDLDLVVGKIKIKMSARTLLKFSARFIEIWIRLSRDSYEGGNELFALNESLWVIEMT